MLLAKPTPFDGTHPVTDWAQAQELTNFILLRPKPTAGWRVHDASVRGESSKHYSSLRLVVERAGIKFRLKQSFNDYWVPVSNDINLRRVEGHFLLGDDVVFTGKDYHGRPGATAQILGTTVEAYLMEGMPIGDHWRECFSALEPALPAIVSEARKTTFAERNYWNRWKRDVGLWDSFEFTRVKWMRPDPETFAKVDWASTPDVWAAMPGAPDSIASLDGPKGREIQVLFRQPMTLNYSSWFRVSEPVDSGGPIAPRDTRYPKLAEKVNVRGVEVALASLQPAVGAWFFAWQTPTRGYEMHLRAAKGRDQSQAVATLSMVIGNAGLGAP